jgi:hypothetical protein
MKKYYESKDGDIIRFEYVVCVLKIPANSDDVIGHDNDAITVTSVPYDRVFVALLNGTHQIVTGYDFINKYKEWADNIDSEFEKYERLSVHAAEVANKLSHSS